MDDMDDFTNGKPTGYSFTYSSNQNLSANTTGNSTSGFSEENILLCDYENKNDPDTRVIQLLKEALYILGKLNSIAVAPYYDNLNISGMVRITDDITDIMLCSDSDISNWSFFNSAAGNGILITQHANLNELSATGMPCHIHDDLPNLEFQLILQSKAESLPPSEPGHLFEETHYLIAPEALQNYLLNTSTEETYINPLEINTVLGEIKELICDILEQDITDNSLTERVAIVRQKVEQLTKGD